MEDASLSQDFHGAFSQASQPFAFESQDDGPSQQAYNFLEEEEDDVGSKEPLEPHDESLSKPLEVEEAYPEAGVSEGGAAPLDFVECGEADSSAPTELPYWACTYCNIHSPASVVKCSATGKWFCNAKIPGLPASCIVYHLVRSKHNEVVLHKESPLGEITLECFLTGTKNVFQLGAPPIPPTSPSFRPLPSYPPRRPPTPTRATRMCCAAAGVPPPPPRRAAPRISSCRASPPPGRQVSCRSRRTSSCCSRATRRCTRPSTTGT